MAPKNNGNKKRDQQPKTPVTSDPRFASVHNDPRFVRPKKRDMKVTIDKRFAGMMNSAEFSDGPRVDKYGRRLKQDTAKKELERFYQLEDESDEEEEEKSLEQLEKELAEDEENLRDEKSEEEVDAKDGYDPMRGRGVISSSDEDTDEEDIESEEESEDEIDKIKRIEEGDETSRLALVNMDWDKIKAVDILKVLSGFKPDTGIIKSVTIYPSEFGKERIALEESQGPPKEIFKSKAIGEEDKDSDDEEVTAEKMIKNQLEEGDGQDFDQEALRKYQLDRLKYYYAVVECDSPATAKSIYKTCDNTEYENSANFFDLRYIPEDMSFDDEPKDAATVAPDGYTPTQFKTDALQRTKVTLTWDEDDVNRYQLTRREFTQDDLKDLDFDAYLASSDDDEEEEDVDALRAKYKKLLSSGSKTSAYDDKNETDDEEEGDMEITFTPGLSEAAGFTEKEQDKEEETTIEKYVRKQKEKRQKKKQSKQAVEQEDSDMDEETANDPFFKEAMEEMEEEGLVQKEKKKSKKKRATKAEREEKARERAELELLMDDDGKSEGFNMKEVLKREKLEKKKKGKKSKLAEMGQDDFEINVNDPRFAAVQDSHHFAIDPTNPQFKKTKSMQKLLNARQTKLKSDTEGGQDEWKKESKKNNSSNTNAETGKSSSSLQQLVASVKRKGKLEKKDSGKRQKK